LRKSLIMLLTLLLLLALVPAVSAQDSPLRLMGYEEADSNRVWANHRFFERMENLSGLKFEFIQHSDLAGYREALNAYQPDDPDLPQVLFKARLDPVWAQQLLERGLLVDLAPHLAEHAPNLHALMQRDPAIARAITLPGGAIPALPYIADKPGQNILWVNKAWLEELKLPLPASLEQFEQALAAFKTRDPNRNGRQDEVPLSALGPYDLKYLAHAWGLVGNDFNLYVDEEGQVRFMPLAENFGAFLGGLASWYEQGLLDRDSFTAIDSLRRVTDAKATNRFGAFLAPLPTVVVPLEWTTQYHALLPFPHEGQAVYRAVAGRVYYGAFALTSASGVDLPRLLSWVDRLYAPEGAILAGVGVEGEDYVVDGDGSWRLLREPGDRVYLSDVIIATDHAAPGIAMDGFQRSFSDPLVRSLSEQTDQVAAASILPFPDIPLTQAEMDAIAPLQAQLGLYVDESIARFVLGEWQVTPEQLTAFQERLNELGVEQFLGIWQQIYDRGMGKDGV